MSFNARLLRDMQISSQENVRVTMYLPGHVVTGTVTEYDEDSVTLVFAGSSTTGKPSVHVVDIESVCGYTLNVQ